MSNFTFLHNVKIVLSSAAYLNLGRAQNDVLGNGLNRNRHTRRFHCTEKKKFEVFPKIVKMPKMPCKETKITQTLLLLQVARLY